VAVFKQATIVNAKSDMNPRNRDTNHASTFLKLEDGFSTKFGFHLCLVFLKNERSAWKWFYITVLLIPLVVQCCARVSESQYRSETEESLAGTDRRETVK
jgi:hypothetical protein